METPPIIDVLLSSWEEKEKVLSSTYKRLWMLDILAFASSFLGLIVFQLETNFYYEQIEYQTEPVLGAIQDKNFPNVISYKEEDENYENFIYRVILLTSTCFLSYLLILRARTYLFYLKITNRIEIGASYYSSGILITLILELIFNLIISFPKNNAIFAGTQQEMPLNYSFSLFLLVLKIISWKRLDQFFSLIQFGRFYILVRMWTQYSIWNKDKSVLICNLCNTDGGVGFAMKAEFKSSPVIMVGVLFSACTLILGICTRTSERSFMYTSGLNWDYVWNGMWMTIIIITTVGYGDFYPRTYLGRVFVFFTCCFGPFLISMVNVSICNYMFFSKEQERAFEKIKKREDIIKYYHLASDCIKISLKYWGHINLKLKSARSENSMKIFGKIFDKYKEIFMKFHHMRLLINTAGFNKPFDEALPIFMKNQEISLNKIIDESSLLNADINIMIDRIANVNDSIEMKIKEVVSRYSALYDFVNNHPSHKFKFHQFKSFNFTKDAIPFKPLDTLPLNFEQLISIHSIKEIISKEKIENFQSTVNIQSPISSKSMKSKKAQAVTMVEINDIVKQLTKKRKNDYASEDSPRKPVRTRSNIKKSTMISQKKQSDADELEIIQEEDNKEVLVGNLPSTAEKTSPNKFQKGKRIPNFQRIDDSNEKSNHPPEFKRINPKSHQKIRKIPNHKNDGKNLEHIESLKSNKSIRNDENKSSSHPSLNKIGTIGNNNNNNGGSEQTNFSVNFSSQMQSNIPFNMSVNVNTNPIFNLSTKYNPSNFPLIINVESNKNGEKNPIYPDQENLIEDGKSKNSSFKMEDSFKEKNSLESNPGSSKTPNNNNIMVNNNLPNNPNSTPKNIINQMITKSNSSKNFAHHTNNIHNNNTSNNNNNSLYRQRKIIIEHSMLITESFVETTQKNNREKDSNKNSAVNILGKTYEQKPPMQKVEKEKEGLQENEKLMTKKTLSGVD